MHYEIERVILRKPEPEDIASEFLIDALFKKMNSVFNTYRFTPEQCAEALKLNPQKTQRICDIERIPASELTFADLKEYYELHSGLWKMYHAKSNSLVDRFNAKIKRA